MSKQQGSEGPVVVAPRDNRPLYLQVADALRSSIGSLAPGAKLPTRQQLATLYNVAPMTVQHALRELREEGLIVSIHGRGVFVSESGTRRRHGVNWDWLAEALAMSCVIRGMSMREAAKAIGIDHSALSRLKHGKHLSADALAALVAWLFPTQIPLWIQEG